MDIMIKPIVTEKATKLTEKLNRYTFCVSPEANKYQIKAQKGGAGDGSGLIPLLSAAKTSRAGLRAVCSAVIPAAGKKPSSH